MLLACLHRLIHSRNVRPHMTPEVWAGVSVALALVSLACTCVVLWRTQHPAALGTRVRELELQLADVADYVERRDTRERVRKMRDGRAAAAAQNATAPEPGTPEYKAALRAVARQKGLQ